MEKVQFEAVTIVPNTYHHPLREIDTVVHGVVAEMITRIFLKGFLRTQWRSSESGGLVPGARAQERCSNVSSVGLAMDSLGRQIRDWKVAENC